jgi:hypothetical protein
VPKQQIAATEVAAIREVEPCKGKHPKLREGADVEEALTIVVLHEQLNREAISGTPQRPVRRKRRSQFHHMTGISRLSI